MTKPKTSITIELLASSCLYLIIMTNNFWSNLFKNKPSQSKKKNNILIENQPKYITGNEAKYIIDNSLKEYIETTIKVNSKENLQWYIGTVGLLLVFILSLAGVAFVFNTGKIDLEVEKLNTYKQTLQTEFNDLKEELLGIEKEEALLKLLDSNKEPLDGKILEVENVYVIDRNGVGFLTKPKYQYRRSFIVKNEGKGYVNYKNSYIVLYNNSSELFNDCPDDNQNFNDCNIETVSENNAITKLSEGSFISLPRNTTTTDKPEKGKTEKVKIKIVYGNQEVESVFYLKFSEKLTFVPFYSEGTKINM